PPASCWRPLLGLRDQTHRPPATHMRARVLAPPDPRSSASRVPAPRAARGPRTRSGSRRDSLSPPRVVDRRSPTARHVQRPAPLKAIASPILHGLTPCTAIPSTSSRLTV